MNRLTIVAALVAVPALASSVAWGETQAELAAKLDKEGQSLMWAEKWSEATAKFRAASARVPEPLYYAHLCMSLMHEGSFGEALTACNHGKSNNPDADVSAKIDRAILKVHEEAKKQGVTLDSGGGGGGGGGGSEPNPGFDCAVTPDDPRCAPPPDVCRTNPQDPSCAAARPQFAKGRPLTGTGIFGGTTPDNHYTWTLGIDLFGGGGEIGRKDFYGSIAGGFRIKSDYLIDPAQRIGTQVYLGLTHFAAGDMDSAAVDTLDIVDFGAAIFKHFCPDSAPRLCVTPLVGAQLALMSPAGEEDGAGSQVFNYAAVGGRGELGFQYAFGTRMEHVLGVSVGLNIYSKVLQSSYDDEFGGGISTEAAGLDKGGLAGYVGIGYTHRFRTPLGSPAFVTL